MAARRATIWRITCPLTQRQIEYGFDYYFKDDWDDIDDVTTVEEFRGQARLSINCTQLAERGYASATDRKRIVAEWCKFLEGHPRQFTQLAFGTRLSQEVVDAVGCQVNLKRLDIKWGAYQDLSPIANLRKLELLWIGTGAGVKSIAPLTDLPRLVGLSIENFQKVSDYSPLSQLRKLQSLTIEGDGLGPQYIRIESLKFLEKMTQLRHLKLLTYRLRSKDYQPILKLRKLESLSLPSSREVKSCYDQLVALPKLQWGFLKTQPKLYKK